MAYQALYRKYRPDTFSDVVGQEHITDILKKELQTGTTVHAYLFTGSRGTGKTSCAKILAKAVNCLSPVDGDPCLECESCVAISDGENTDIVEIDAASNNGVDNIRELRDMINFAPNISKYRVYIIDEVHMLSSGAFNALLKTLEEPPSHVIFILATTEVHKLPATILSRCQRFDFRRIEASKIAQRLCYIAEQEGFTITDAAATLIAAAADGGMRDALSILDLCASDSKDIDEACVEKVCAMAGNEYLLEMADAIKEKDTERALTLIDRLHMTSVDMLRLLSELTSHYRDLMVVKTVRSANRPVVCSAERMAALEIQADRYELKEIIACLNILQAAFPAMQTGNRRCEMEMAVIRMCEPALSFDMASLERRISALEKGISLSPTPVKPKIQESVDSVETNTVAEPEEIIENEATVEPQVNTSASVASSDATQVAEWGEVLKILAVSCPLIAGVLKGSKAYIKGEYLLIDAGGTQFRNMINSSGGIYKEHIRKAAQSVLGQVFKLGPWNPPKAVEETDPLVLLSDKLKNLEI